MTTAEHPEEIECFRMPMPDGRFSPDKRYEYTYATRKSWEYNPVLRRKDWRYFTTKAFTYAGKWLRSERRGWGDGADCWEVFLDDRVGTGGKEKEVSWDYDGTMCWRECPYITDEYFVGTVTRKLMDEMITEVERVSPTIHHNDTKATATPAPEPTSWSLIRCVFGNPCKCAPFDTAEITTMEPKYRVNANIAEFWCFLTSVFYGSSLLLYFVKEEDWYPEWWSAGWPAYIHFSIVMAVMVMFSSAIYHARLIECIGCVDCFFASFLYVSVTMTGFGVDVVTQIGVLLLLGVIHLYAWRYITRFAILIMGATFPFAFLSYMRMKSYYGGAILTLILTGSTCFFMDRIGIAPLHSAWHVFSGTAIALILYYVVVNGTVTNDFSI